MRRRSFLKNASLAAVGFPFLDKIGGQPVVGHGDFRFKINLDWCRAAPAETPVNDCHEMAFDRRGRIFMSTNDPKNNVVIFSKDGRALGSWAVDLPGAHGLTLSDEGGEEFRYLTCTERRAAVKTTLDGRVVQRFEWPEGSPFYSKKEDFCPTETAVLPSGEIVVADGYGQDCLIKYDQKGQIQQVFGGKKELSNAHGIALDTRDSKNSSLLVTSRADNFLKKYSLDGLLLESCPLPGAFICRPQISGKNVFFAVLVSEMPWDGGTGFVLILDEKNAPVSAPCGSAPSFEKGILQPFYQTVRAFRHPHDALPDPSDGSVYVCQWNTGRVFPARLERV